MPSFLLEPAGLKRAAEVPLERGREEEIDQAANDVKPSGDIKEVVPELAGGVGAIGREQQNLGDSRGDVDGA